MQGLYQVNLSTTALAALLCADNPAIDQIQVAGMLKIPLQLIYDTSERDI